jgi:hypothetical protein
MVALGELARSWVLETHFAQGRPVGTGGVSYSLFCVAVRLRRQNWVEAAGRGR